MAHLLNLPSERIRLGAFSFRRRTVAIAKSIEGHLTVRPLPPNVEVNESLDFCLQTNPIFSLEIS